ncbi:hypothetical protein, partial [Arcticibacter tournemirensis]
GSGPDPGTGGAQRAHRWQACGRIGREFIDSLCCFHRLFIDSHSNKLAPSVVAPGYAPAVSLPPGCHKTAAKVPGSVPEAPMNRRRLFSNPFVRFE